MELYVDTGDLKKIKEVAEYYPIDGFTTNPKILSVVEEDMDQMIPAYREFVRERNCRIFMQVTGDTAEEMLREAKKLRAYYGENFVVKIPAVKEGYKAVSLCKKEGLCVCVTVVHSVMQAIVAAAAGADYVAPYINHIDNLGGSGTEAVKEMLEAFKNGGYSCKVLGASFRTVTQIKDLIVNGTQSITIKAEMFDDLIAHPSTTESMEGFNKTWKSKFGDRQVSELLPEE